jgi:hypothetical protein
MLGGAARKWEGGEMCSPTRGAAAREGETDMARRAVGHKTPLGKGANVAKHAAVQWTPLGKGRSGMDAVCRPAGGPQRRNQPGAERNR